MDKRRPPAIARLQQDKHALPLCLSFVSLRRRVHLTRVSRSWAAATKDLVGCTSFTLVLCIRDRWDRVPQEWKKRLTTLVLPMRLDLPGPGEDVWPVDKHGYFHESALDFDPAALHECCSLTELTFNRLGRTAMKTGLWGLCPPRQKSPQAPNAGTKEDESSRESAIVPAAIQSHPISKLRTLSVTHMPLKDQSAIASFLSHSLPELTAFNYLGHDWTSGALIDLLRGLTELQEIRVGGGEEIHDFRACDGTMENKSRKIWNEIGKFKKLQVLHLPTLLQLTTPLPSSLTDLRLDIVPRPHMVPFILPLRSQLKRFELVADRIPPTDKDAWEISTEMSAMFDLLATFTTLELFRYRSKLRVPPRECTASLPHRLHLMLFANQSGLVVSQIKVKPGYVRVSDGQQTLIAYDMIMERLNFPNNGGSDDSIQLKIVPERPPLQPPHFSISPALTVYSAGSGGGGSGRGGGRISGIDARDRSCSNSAVHSRNASANLDDMAAIASIASTASNTCSSAIGTIGSSATVASSSSVTTSSTPSSPTPSVACSESNVLYFPASSLSHVTSVWFTGVTPAAFRSLCEGLEIMQQSSGLRHLGISLHATASANGSPNDVPLDPLTGAPLKFDFRRMYTLISQQSSQLVSLDLFSEADAIVGSNLLVPTTRGGGHVPTLVPVPLKHTEANHVGFELLKECNDLRYLSIRSLDGLILSSPETQAHTLSSLKNLTRLCIKAPRDVLSKMIPIIGKSTTLKELHCEEEFFAWSGVDQEKSNPLGMRALAKFLCGLPPAIQTTINGSPPNKFYTSNKHPQSRCSVQ